MQQHMPDAIPLYLEDNFFVCLLLITVIIGIRTIQSHVLGKKLSGLVRQKT